MIYRGTVEFAQVKAVCMALSNKRTVSITATKRKLVETVDVSEAAQPCWLPPAPAFHLQGTQLPCVECSPAT